jgi:hypothetical protein
MAKMGSYCKAYPVEMFRAFSGWEENHQNLRKEKKEIDGKEVEERRELSENDHFYLQENLVVTDGIFMDENIIFDNITPEWEAYCKDDLKFQVPDYETAKAAGATE